MINSLEISNFKKFEKLKLDHLSQVNLFVGTNNIGKTSLLEAIFAFTCGQNANPFLSGCVFRRLQGEANLWQSPYSLVESIWNMFHDKKNVQNFCFSFGGDIDGDWKKVVHHFEPGAIFSDFLPNEMGAFGSGVLPPALEDKTNEGENRQGETILGRWNIAIDKVDPVIFPVTYPFPSFREPLPVKNPLILTKMSDILSHRNEMENRRVFSFLSRSGLVREMICELNRCFTGESITDINSIPYPDGSAAPITVRFANGMSYPLYALGDGMRRWFHLIGSMLVYKNAVHCIEEMDATFHHQAQEDLSYYLCHYSKACGNQLFITTHNQEYLQSFLASIKNHESDSNLSLRDDIRVITLRKMGHEVRTRTLDGLDATKALRAGLELRV